MHEGSVADLVAAQERSLAPRADLTLELQTTVIGPIGNNVVHAVNSANNNARTHITTTMTAAEALVVAKLTNNIIVGAAAGAVMNELNTQVATGLRTDVQYGDTIIITDAVTIWNPALETAKPPYPERQITTLRTGEFD